MTQPAGQTRSLDEMLERIREAGTEPGASVPATDALIEHTDILRATRDAQQQAQDMLAMATRVRTAASEQAEQMLREAREQARMLTADVDQHSSRVRAEVAEWAAEQRTQVQAVVAQLIADAHREADQIRAEALGRAMAEAEETARRYIADAVARGSRDAELIRNEARELVDRARAAAGETVGSIRRLLEAGGGALADFDGHRDTFDRLATETAATADSAPLAPATGAAHTPSAEPQVVTAEAPTSAFAQAAGHGSESAVPTARPLGSLFRVSDVEDATHPAGPGQEA